MGRTYYILFGCCMKQTLIETNKTDFNSLFIVHSYFKQKFI